MPYRHDVIGTEALSYGHGTQSLMAYAGDPMRMHVVAAVSEQVQSFSLDGHRWHLEPRAKGSNIVATQAIGAREVLTIVPLGGAGGEAHLPGDFVYGDSRGPYRDAGVWGVLHVYPRHQPGLAPLSSGPGLRIAALAVGALALLLLVLSAVYLRSRSRRVSAG